MQEGPGKRHLQRGSILCDALDASVNESAVVIANLTSVQRWFDHFTSCREHLSELIDLNGNGISDRRGDDQLTLIVWPVDESRILVSISCPHTVLCLGIVRIVSIRRCRQPALPGTHAEHLDRQVGPFVFEQDAAFQLLIGCIQLDIRQHLAAPIIDRELARPAVPEGSQMDGSRFGLQSHQGSELGSSRVSLHDQFIAPGFKFKIARPSLQLREFAHRERERRSLR